ncbi:CaiB/BaiF CoA transferase family protein [Zunongwangia endophytica]|uniref:CaiB/BaiF CoA transferase family protein n=1 Tax=Zunongwangia endophytica TaxID=1808945 RepID=A0ABV8HA21_9FLAO|nr:CaiB/BaiF CoA-transferase family protein [Zunongwangia endophytica]MDN3594851.1 CaiB/BaiF CoA-transferase family protein [Zunongwangia endophytica]
MKNKTNNKPLKGILVLEFCQYLAGPSAGLRLADLGARVIKIENPGKGDLCRILPIKDQWVKNNSLLFHTINRNKESYTANLKSVEELDNIRKLIEEADVIIHNFRPGVMKKLGLDFDQAKECNPELVYAEISGYGKVGPWGKKPGQDLLVQAMSGLMYASGDRDDAPTPFGLAIGDILCGAQVVQAILAALVYKNRKKKAIKIEVSLLESLIDFQFEIFTTYFASGKLPKRSLVNNAHALLGAPYGIYKTKDGYIALAMIPLQDLKEIIQSDLLNEYDQSMVFSKRDEIKSILVDLIKENSSKFWIEKLLAKGLWATSLKNWKELKNSQSYEFLKLEQEIQISINQSFKTNRCPIRINGEIMWGSVPAPDLGADNEVIKKEFNLNPEHS